MTKQVDLSTGGGMRRSNYVPRAVRKKAGIRISHRQHTGHRLPIYHTSYALLFFILVLTGITLFFARQQTAQAGPPQVQNGNIGLSGIVPGPPPSTAAQIVQPNDGDIVTQANLTVAGTCTPALIVEIYRNNAFAGSDICSGSGTFSLVITVVEGTNELIAKIKDGLDQYGPDSTPVFVTYNVTQTTETTDSDDEDESGRVTYLPLIIYTIPVQRGSEPEDIIKLEYEIEGGQAPYAVVIDWGDNTDNSLSPHQNAGDFSKEHTYKNAGQYRVKLAAQDNLGNRASIQTIVIINGESNTIFPFASVVCGLGSDSTDAFLCSAVTSISVVWPAFLITSALTVSFWLGEKVVYWRLRREVSNVAK